MGPEMNYVGEKPADPMTFVIYPDESGQASTALYEDDGLSPAYKQGVFRRTRVSVSRSASGFQIDVNAPEGSYNPGPRSFVFVIRAASAAGQILVAGKPLGLSAPNERKSGWYQINDNVAVRIADEGKAHRIQVR
jgi:hypothetical protein